MSTRGWTRGHVQDGNVLRDTGAQVAAKQRSAAARQRPWCRRKSALMTVPSSAEPLRGRYCRWPDCDWEHTRDADVETIDEALARWAAADSAHAERQTSGSSS